MQRLTERIRVVDGVTLHQCHGRWLPWTEEHFYAFGRTSGGRLDVVCRECRRKMGKQSRERAGEVQIVRRRKGRAPGIPGLAEMLCAAVGVSSNAAEAADVVQ